MCSNHGHDEAIKKMRQIGEKAAKSFKPIVDNTPKAYFSEYMLNRIQKATQMNEQTEKIIKDINSQFDSLRETIARMEREAPDYMRVKFDYIEENGLPNGFAYTAYMSADDQIKIIEKYLERESVDDLILNQLKDGFGDLEWRYLKRLEYGKELAKLHIDNIFNGTPLLSLHYLVSQVEELLKCYHGVPSTNEMKSSDSRFKIRDDSTERRKQLIDTINSPYHSVELVKKSYDDLLIDGFYKSIRGETKAENLPYINRHDVMHVYSDLDRFTLLDVYKLLLLVSSLLDLLEILDILDMEESESVEDTGE